MLRISPLTKSGSSSGLRVEGKLMATNVRVLVEACHDTAAEEVVLDFTGVNYVDPAASQTLRKLTRGRVRIVGCSPLIRGLLEEVSQ